MSKRIATSQLTQDSKDLDDTESIKPPGITMASDEVMSTRKIAMPKRPMKFSMSNSLSQITPIANSISSTFSSINGNHKDDGSLMRLAKHKALNIQFQAKINEIMKKDAYANLGTIFEKYKTYLSSIEQSIESNTNTLPTNSTISKNADAIKKPNSNIESKQESDSESDSDDESMKEVKVEGPQFTLSVKPTTTSSVFSFGPKKVEPKSDDDSESDIEIKGPQFNFKGTVESNVFKLQSKETSEEEKNAIPNEKIDEQKSIASEKTPETISTTVEISEEKDKPVQPSLSFQLPSSEKPIGTKETPNPFLDNNTITTETDKKTPASTAPVFNFRVKPKTTEDPATNKPNFSFSFSNANTKEDSKTKEISTSIKSAFSNDALSSESKSNEDNTNTPSFSFGKKPTENDTFSTTKSSFSFGTSTSNNTENKPSFNFTAPTNTESKSTPFTFGVNNTNDTSNKPSFAFNTAPTTNNTPPADFKFSLPFGKNENATSTDTKESNPSDNKENQADQPNNTDEKQEEINMHNGEENENVLFSNRAKLMIFNSETKKYDSKGLGEMRLLQDKEDQSKVRFLCRSDGMGHILLNSLLIKKFNFGPLTPQNENMIKVPIVDETGKLVTYIVRFKQKADGRLFVKAIEDAQNNM